MRRFDKLEEETGVVRGGATAEHNPLQDLYAIADQRGLDVEFTLVEERAPTAMHLKSFVMQLSLFGDWFEMLDDGSQKRETKVRMYQGVDMSTRRARIRAAEAALARMDSLEPGLAFGAGQLPPEWRSWLFRSLDEGRGMIACLGKLLSEKRFIPAKNSHLMQVLLTRYAFDKLQQAQPDVCIEADGAVPSEWLALARDRMTAGIEGWIVLEELQRRGLDTSRQPHLEQQLLKNKGNFFLC